MHIDPHVHCRDWNQAYKSTIKDVANLARKQGIIAIFDMPNTDPPIISENLVKKRLGLAEKEGCSDVYYLFVGITKNPKQIEECVEIVRKYPKVVGIKMFAGKSIGDLAITDEKDQAKVYKELAERNYTGVLAVHCEKESFFNFTLWDPNRPSTWNLVRPIKAEIESVKDQTKFAKEAGFKGTLHICHVSSPQAVDIIQKAKSELNITCGVTPHHLIYSTRDMENRKGLTKKVNPPLRDHETAIVLRNCLKEGKIDWIETDHAPHTREEKIFPPYLSGIKSLKLYSIFLNYLRNCGFSEEQISRLTYHNIKKVFKI